MCFCEKTSRERERERKKERKKEREREREREGRRRGRGDCGLENWSGAKVCTCFKVLFCIAWHASKEEEELLFGLSRTKMAVL